MRNRVDPVAARRSRAPAGSRLLPTLVSVWFAAALPGGLVACSSGTPEAPQGATGVATPGARGSAPAPGDPRPDPAAETPRVSDPPVPPSVPTDAPPAAIDMARAVCTLGEPVVLGETTDRRPKMVATLDAAGGFAAWTADAEHVNAVSLDATGAPRSAPTSVPMTGARDLFGVYRVGAGHVLATHPLCAPRSLKCVDLLAFDERGAALGEPFSHQVGEWIVQHHVRVEGRALTLLRSHTYRPLIVERYVLGDAGAFEVETLATFDFGEDEAPDAAALGLALDGARWAALGEADVSSGRRRRLYLSDGTSATVQGVFPPTAVTDLRFVGDALRVVFGAEGRRPARVAMLAANGTLERARELGADEALPPGTTTPHVERQTDGSYAVVWRDLGARAMGATVAVGDRALDADGADGVAVLYGFDGPRSGARATLRVLRCQS